MLSTASSASCFLYNKKSPDAKHIRAYTAINKNKFKQMVENPKVEISCMNKKGQWIRVTGEVANDDRREAKEFALESNPFLKSGHNVDDGVFAVLYFTKGTSTIYSYTEEPETFSL